MIRFMAMLSMIMSLLVRRSFCGHQWKTTKNGWIFSSPDKTLRGADIQVCQKCGKVSMVTTENKRYYRIAWISKVFIPRVTCKGDEDVWTFKIQVKTGGRWCTLEGGILHRGVAVWQMRALQDEHPDDIFQVVPEQKNGWNQVSNRR